MKQESLLKDESPKVAVGPVECLGLTFANDEARRAHFTDLLRQKLKDPEFKAIEGFPIGTDEAILELSDPPYYTACPNPWLNDFVELWESQKADLDGEYHREPFAADVSEGKNNQVYRAHPYHTKVPHKAIMRYILHYTNPGDIVFDGFCGSGMTGVASQLCNDIQEIESLDYKVIASKKIVDGEGNIISEVGERFSILNDIAPIGSFISSNYTLAVDSVSFLKECNDFYNKIEDVCRWMFLTVPEINKHKIEEYVKEIGNFKSGDSKLHDELGLINFTVWSDIYSCPECDSEYNYYRASISNDNGKVLAMYDCPFCKAKINKAKSGKVLERFFDNHLGADCKRLKKELVEISYTYKGKRYSKKPDDFDKALLVYIGERSSGQFVPIERMMKGQETRRNDPVGLTHVHHYYTDRNLCLLAEAMSLANNNNLLLALTGINLSVSKMYRWTPEYQGGGPMSGTLYVPALLRDISALDALKRFLVKLPKMHHALRVRKIGDCAISTGSSTNLVNIKSNCVDYIFLDPPFGANINYSELSFLWESWLRVWTAIENEAIENKKQGKSVDDYRELMSFCFKEAYRLLKPGKWMTVEFSNTKAAVWNSLQIALESAGFIVADVSALDKKQGSFKAVTTATAVKQDLVLSVYKPSKDFERVFENDKGNIDGVWGFVSSHLSFLPIIKVQHDELIKVPERDARILFDRVVSFYVRNGIQVPLSSHEFQSALAERFVERDGMFFLPDQIVVYDKKRALSSNVRQLSIFVDDEASAIEWMRQELKSKPKTYSEIHPLFLNELSGWKKNELSLELSTLLEQNFIKYDGVDEVPSQIHTYLSTNFKDMRGLEKDDPTLKAKAKDRWYVPDPNKAEDLDKVRLRALLREFETYKTQKKIKLPRAEALRAGFKTAWETQDFQTILDIAAKIPTDVLQEDEKLLMFYDNALTLTSTEEDEW